MRRLILSIVLVLCLAGIVNAQTVTYGTIGTGATATQVDSTVELHTDTGLLGSGYVRLEIPGGIALNAITSLSYTAQVTAPGAGGYAPEVVLNIDADNDGSLEGDGINWMLQGWNPTALGYVDGTNRGDNFLSGDQNPPSVGVADVAQVNRDALTGYSYWSANNARNGLSPTLYSPWASIPYPVHDIDATDMVYSIDFVVGTSGNFDGMTAVFSSVELNGVTYPVIEPELPPPTEPTAVPVMSNILIGMLTLVLVGIGLIGLKKYQ